MLREQAPVPQCARLSQFFLARVHVVVLSRAWFFFTSASIFVCIIDDFVKDGDGLRSCACNIAGTIDL